MKRPSLLGLLGILSASIVVNACDDGRAQQPVPATTVRDALTQLARGEGDPTPLTVSFDHLEALHGGLQLTIHGDGKVEQRALRMTVREAKDKVAPEDLRTLVGALTKHEVWIQRVDDRQAVPDESRATLRTCYRDQCVDIWEWYNDLEKNARIGEVLGLMQKVAWPAPAPDKWTLTIRTRGGFFGKGTGGITATSEEVAPPGCEQRAADLEALTRAVAEAQPATWAPSYVSPKNPNGCCDQFRYTMTLEVQPADGPSTKHETFWYSEMSNTLPVHVRAVFDAAWKIKTDVAAKCKPG